MPTAEDWHQHWDFGEAGCVRLRPQHGTHIATEIVVALGQVRTFVHAPVEGREHARFLACRLMEAVAIAEMQELGVINP